MTQRAVVIGSGVGGLTSALLLARHGYDVTVLEQHYRPGGFLHRFFREAVPYDTGFHYCGGIGEEDALGRAWRHLGVFDALTFRALDPGGFDRLRFPDLELSVPVGVEAFHDRLVEAFPHEAAAIRRYLDDVVACTRNYGLYAFTFDIDVSRFLEWEERSLWEYLEANVRDERLRAVLCGQGMLYAIPPRETPFSLHAVITHHFLKGAWRIEGGGDRLALTMVRQLRGLGGRIHLKTAATAIEVDEDRVARAVIDAHGERHPADLVIANVHPRIVSELLPDHAIRRSWRNRVARTRVAVPHLGVYIQTDGPNPGIGNANLYRHRTWDAHRSHDHVDIGDCPFYYATAPGEGESSRRPGRDVVLMLAPMRAEQTARFRDGADPQGYSDYKARLQDTMVDALLEDFPETRIRRIEASTGLSTERFVGAPEGSIYGHYHSVEQMGRHRPSQVTRVRGLVLVGHGVFAPGILGATLSAYYGCSFVLGQETILEGLRGE